MPTRLTDRLAAVILPLIALAPACTTSPGGGSVYYDYQVVSTDLADPVPFGTALAAGLQLDVAVFSAGAVHAPASFDTVQAHNPGVVRVAGHGTGKITLAGQGAGDTQVDVISGASVKSVDTFDVTVADIARVDLVPPGQPPLRVVAGGTLHLGMTLSDASGARVVGYGAVPVDIAPASAGVAVASRSLGVYQARFDQLGDATLTGRGASPIAVTVVAADQVASLDVSLAAASVAFGGRTVAAVSAQDASGAPIFGLADTAVVTTSTPTICKLAPDAADGDDAFTVSGIGHGVCTIEASVGGITASGAVEFR